MININKLELTAKEQNILSILDCIIDLKETSSVEIARRTGLSMSTISRVINLLRSKNMVLTYGKEVTELGRRPVLLRFNKNYGQIIYMNISHEKISGYIADLDGKMLYKDQYDFEKEITVDLCLEGLGYVYNNLIQSSKSNKDKILALGISVPGVVDKETNIIKRIPNIYSFNEINLIDHIKGILNLPTIISNDSRLSVVGQKIESYKDYNNIVYINITYYGIGAGVVLNGNLYTGSKNAAGEIGEMFFDRANFQTGVQDTGCLEAYAGLHTLNKRIEAAMQQGKANVLKGIMKKRNSGLNLEVIEEAVRQQDYDVQEILDDIIKTWSMAIISIFSLLDPEIIVLGGMVGAKNKLILNKIKYFVGKAKLFDVDRIKLDSIGEKAQISGGAYVLKHYVFNKIISSEAIKE